MPNLPFQFDANEFHPLQPEDQEGEYARRTNPKYAHLYVNVAQGKFESSATPNFNEGWDPDAKPAPEPVSEYADWLAVCRSMDEEVERARMDWRASVIHRDLEIARLKAETEAKRTHLKLLELRQKPPQPRSARKGPAQ